MYNEVHYDDHVLAHWALLIYREALKAMPALHKHIHT